MELGAAGLKEQPFPPYGNTPALVEYTGQQEAQKALSATRAARNGICLFQGPALSGKTTIIRQFVRNLPEDTASAIVDGHGQNAIGLLRAVLQQFGYVLDHGSITENLAMLRVFAMQQLMSQEAPILIIENAHALNPSAQRALCELAELKVRGNSALKLILVSDRALLEMMDTPAMEAVNKRLTQDFHLRPMTNTEATHYLHSKLIAAGSAIPEFVFPAAICTELWRASGGWPGILDRLALLALAKSETLPVAVELIERPALPSGTWIEASTDLRQRNDKLPPGPPILYVTHNGETLHELTFDKVRLLIGRSEHNDIPLSSKFVSRHHAMLVRHGNATFLMDLNSTNGTFVNSKRVSNHVLVHDDIIMLGQHRIKFIDPHATRRRRPEGDKFAETVIMKTLDDMRNLLAEENTAILPAFTGDLPNSG